MSQKLPSYFATLDSFSLCRGGGNGPRHTSQLYAIKKYVQPGMTFLDYGCGSGTTYEAIIEAGPDKINYLGVDIVKKNVDWCNEHFGVDCFTHNPSQDTIDQPDKSFDVVFSRHVVDHMRDFQSALAEHCRVAKKLVIIVLWYSFSPGDEDELQHIHNGGVEYSEYGNSYSRKTVNEAVKDQEQNGWKLLEIAENLKGVDGPAANHDVVIVLGRSDAA